MLQLVLKQNLAIKSWKDGFEGASEAPFDMFLKVDIRDQIYQNK